MYQVTWDPSRGKHRIFSAQLRGGYVPQETTQIGIRKQEMYVIFYENHNEVEYRDSNIMTVVGTEDPRINNQFSSNFRKRFLYGMRNRDQIGPVEYKALAQTNVQSSIRRAYSNYTDSEGHIMTYTYIHVTDLDITTPLRMIDYVITTLYETYEWVEWEITAIDSQSVDINWRKIDRREPCQIAEGEGWGIEYTRGTRGTLRVCDFHEYSYMKEVGKNEFTIIMPIGSFEPADLSQDFRYDLRPMNSTVIWRFMTSAISDSVMLQVIFKHGSIRTRPTEIYALVPNEIHSRFYKTFLMSPLWKLDRTKLMIHAQDEMCERTAYTEYIRTLNENDRPVTKVDKYRRLRIMHHRFPESCRIIYRNINNCRKPRFEGQCIYAVGPSEVTYVESNIKTDPSRDEAIIPQGQICFLPNVTKERLSQEIVNSAAVRLFAIKSTTVIKYAVRRRLKTYHEQMQARWKNLANEMNQDLAQLEQSMEEMRAQAIQISSDENLLARYAGRRAVTGTGVPYQEAKDKYLTKRQEIADGQARLRGKELLIGNQGENAQRSLVAYHLYQRILAMLPHLTRIEEFKKGYVYEISLKKGKVLLRKKQTIRQKGRN